MQGWGCSLHTLTCLLREGHVECFSDPLILLLPLPSREELLGHLMLQPQEPCCSRAMPISARSRSCSCSRSHVPFIHPTLSISQMQGKERGQPFPQPRNREKPRHKAEPFYRLQMRARSSYPRGLQLFPQLYVSCSAGRHSPCPAVCRKAHEAGRCSA